MARVGVINHMTDLPAHHLSIALLQPQIAPNTGNIARLCVATGTTLHLVRPLGFVLSDKDMRRSAMDYWPRLRLVLHDDTPHFLEAMANARLWLFSSKGTRSHWDAHFADGDVLVFGNESRGLPGSILASVGDGVFGIPMPGGKVRSLNLATATGIALYEALRQVHGW